MFSVIFSRLPHCVSDQLFDNRGRKLKRNWRLWSFVHLLTKELWRHLRQNVHKEHEACGHWRWQCGQDEHAAVLQGQQVRLKPCSATCTRILTFIYTANKLKIALQSSWPNMGLYSIYISEETPALVIKLEENTRIQNQLLQDSRPKDLCPNSLRKLLDESRRRWGPTSQFEHGGSITS